MIIPYFTIAASLDVLEKKLTQCIKDFRKRGLKVRDLQLVSHEKCLIVLILLDDGN